MYHFDVLPVSVKVDYDLGKHVIRVVLPPAAPTRKIEKAVRAIAPPDYELVMTASTRGKR